jgi:non-ribosomal peptide synthase protein (TIGR01720 family)
VDYSRTSGFQREADYWLGMSKKVNYHLQVDILDGENTYGNTDSISATLDPETTSHLLLRLPSNFNAGVNDALLTALARTMYRWTGSRQLFIELEGHGRESIGDTVLADMDLSRTIGWFTSIFPVVLDLGDSDDIRSQLAQIVDQLELIPNHGLGYGVLRYLTEDIDIQNQLSKMEAPEINFNYLGRFDQSGVELQPGSINKASREDDEHNSENFQNMPPPIRIASEDTGPEQDPASKRSALIYVVATITGNQLGIRWLYSRNIHHRETIEWLANIFLSEIKILADLTK